MSGKECARPATVFRIGLCHPWMALRALHAIVQISEFACLCTGMHAAPVAQHEKHARKQLSLNTETLLRLNPEQLLEAAGGANPGPVSGGTCAGFTCGVSWQCTNMGNCGGWQPRKLV